MDGVYDDGLNFKSYLFPTFHVYFYNKFDYTIM